MSHAAEAATATQAGQACHSIDAPVRDACEDLRAEVVGGLLYAHSRANANTAKALEIASFCYALIELLQEKGILSIAELDQRKDVVVKRLVEKFRDAGMGVMRQEPEQDKYTFGNPVTIDCENRVHLCKAACCRLAFALSKQDVEEGIVKWDFAHPYMNARRSNGYCVHHEQRTFCCNIYANRPIPCRAYDCRNDTRIWVDFEKKIVNPELEAIFSDGHRPGMVAGSGSQRTSSSAR